MPAASGQAGWLLPISEPLVDDFCRDRESSSKKGSSAAMNKSPGSKRWSA
jgi:hypothetical protein